MVCEKCKKEVNEAIKETVKHIKKEWEDAGHDFLSDVEPNGFRYFRKQLKLEKSRGRETA